jgi:ribosome-associated translation inhibitor RaiA
MRLAEAEANQCLKALVEGNLIRSTETQNDMLAAIQTAFKILQRDLEKQSKDEHLLL